VDYDKADPGRFARRHSRSPGVEDVYEDE